MPATNYTPIQLYRSTTSGALPSNANLSPGEVALNIADNDMSMYFENASGTVKRFFNNPAELKYPTADGTSGQFLTTNGSGVLSFGSISAGALTNNTRQAVTSSSTTTINLNSGNVIDLTMAANITTLSFTNVPASGTPILIQIVVKNASDGTAYTIAWPNSVYWSGQYSLLTSLQIQTAPTLATGANGVTVIALLTTDGGTKWRGWVEATIAGGTANNLYGMGSGFLSGTNTSSFFSSPVQIGTLSNWSSVYGRSSASLGLNQSNQLFAWGLNTSGQLGLNDTTPRSSPTQVGSLSNWAFISTSGYNSAAIKNDGTLWTWGMGKYGPLGLNSVTDRSSPVQVGALTTWSKVSCGRYFALAIKTDGTLWAWGSSRYGELGIDVGGYPNARSSPVQVGALTTWSSISTAASSATGARSSFAIKTDGTLWSWGRNFGSSNGILGLGDTTLRSSPVQVGALTDWRSVKAGEYHCVAVKTDNTLWGWGNRQNGRLGLNTNSGYTTSPNQIGALTDWFEVAAGGTFTVAIKTNGTLWTFGSNSSGQLGQGDTISRSSPVQVGSLTIWGPTSGTNRLMSATGSSINVATSQTFNPS